MLGKMFKSVERKDRMSNKSKEILGIIVDDDNYICEITQTCVDEFCFEFRECADSLVVSFMLGKMFKSVERKDRMSNKSKEILGIIVDDDNYICEITQTCVDEFIIERNLAVN